MDRDHRQAGGSRKPAVASADGLDRCRKVLVGGLAWTLAVILVMAADAAFRSDPAESPSARLVEAFDLTTLALVPAGRPLRHPDLWSSAVDPRHLPTLPPADPDPAFLVIPPVSP